LRCKRGFKLPHLQTGSHLFFIVASDYKILQKLNEDDGKIPSERVVEARFLLTRLHQMYLKPFHEIPG
jgi:hypothetical protein